MMPRPSLSFAQRRARLLDAMPDRSAALLVATPMATRNSDVEHPYRAHSDILYLTGLREPEALVLLRKGLEGPSFVMFVRPKDRDKEIWSGYRTGMSGAKKQFGADEAFEIGKVRKHLPDLLREARTLILAFGRLGPFQTVLDEILDGMRRTRRNLHHGPKTLVDPEDLLHEQRLIKDSEELEVMAFAGKISALAHRRAMEVVRPGMYEYQLQAEVEHHFRYHGADGWGYPSIVGAGAHACVLHYVENDGPIGEDDLVLIDAGAEVSGYTADITRTFPASGRFKKGQRELYEAVLDVQKRLIDAAIPGETAHGLQEKAVKWLTEHMVELKLLKGEVDGLIEKKEYKRFYMHNVSHWLGMDVHDVGAYAVDGSPRPFAPGMVLTVEPGLYISPDSKGVPSRFLGLGVRIEDDLVITPEAPRVLTGGAPKEVKDIEGLTRG